MMQDKIKEEIVKAMKAKEEVKLSVLRDISSAFVNEMIKKGKKPDEKISDEDALSVIQRLAKQRKDSIDQFKKGNRLELAEKEEKELNILQEYLPEMMNKEEIKKIAEKKKEELSINDKSKMGILMGSVMKELKGKADGGDVKEVIESLFE